MKAILTFKYIALKSAAKCCCTVVKGVNFSKEAHGKQSKNGRRGKIKASILSKNRYKQSDTRLAWIIFHKIDHMYREIRKQETVQVSLLLQGLRVNCEPTKAAGASPATPNLSMPLQPTITIYPTTVTTVPEDLEDIQPRPYQVWNCENIGFDTNGSWRKVVYTYKLFTGERVWSTQTGETEPFWCTDIIFIRSDGQFFIPPVIVHYAENYTQDLL